MFDLGFFELMVIGIVALIVVGPKDLPVMFRTIGRVTGKARAMAREFTSAMNQAADDSGMRDIQKDLRSIVNPKKAGMDALRKATGTATESVTDWDPLSEAEKAAERSRAASGSEPGAATGAEAKPAETKPAEGPETAALRAKRETDIATAKAEAAARAETAAPESNT